MYGTHLTIDLYEADKKLLTDMEHVYKFLDALPDFIGMKKLTKPQVLQHLAPSNPEWGLTGFVIIAESHIAIHTYPEKGFACVDVFSCNDFNYEKASMLCVECFKAGRHDAEIHHRGKFID